MAKKERKFDLNKNSENKFDLHKGATRRFDLEKDNELDVEKAADAIVPPAPVNTPQPKVPASVNVPHVERNEEEILDQEPEEPKKKGYAWLWALVGIAVVLGGLGMVLLKNGDKAADEADDEATEAVATLPADSTDEGDSATVVPTEESAEQASEAGVNSVDGAASTSEESAPSAQTAATPAPTTTASATAPTSQTASITATQSAPATTTPDSTPTESIETEALNVIKGVYGNGNVRKSRLGARYQEIQARVNQLKQAGKF